MILLIGGKAQGKRAYAAARWGLMSEDMAPCLGGQRVVYALHEIIKGLLEEGTDPMETVPAYAAAHPETIFICDEVGCGVVPVEPGEREWREAVGRCCVALAARCERVERIFCGLPMVLKGEGT